MVSFVALATAALLSAIQPAAGFYLTVYSGTACATPLYTVTYFDKTCSSEYLRTGGELRMNRGRDGVEVVGGIKVGVGVLLSKGYVAR